MFGGRRFCICLDHIGGFLGLLSVEETSVRLFSFTPLPLTGSLFLVTWGLGFRRWATSFHGFAKPKTSLMP